MAEILQVAPTSARGSIVMNAINQIKAAEAILKAEQGILAEAIAGANTTQVEALYGLDNGKGQTFNDRLTNYVSMTGSSTPYKEFANAIVTDFTP